jgi:Cu/Ag efflux pump CusA
VLIIIVVFAPLFTLEGVEGKLFQPMAISIVLAMMASLMVALMVVPALRCAQAFVPLQKKFLSLMRVQV